MRRTEYWLLFAAVIWVAPVIAEVPPAFDSPTVELRRQAKTTALLNIRKYKKEALDILKQQPSGLDLILQTRPPAEIADPREIAIQVLGELRAKEAIKPLIRIVDLKSVSSDSYRGSDPIATQYPAAAALARIGPQSAKSWLGSYMAGNYGGRIDLLCWVIYQTMGPIGGLEYLMKLQSGGNEFSKKKIQKSASYSSTRTLRHHRRLNQETTRPCSRPSRSRHNSPMKTK